MTKPTHALLPIEPTEKMAAVSTWDMHQFYQARRVWADMLKLAPVVQADLCEECQGSFIGFTGPTKWCPYCGARHRGAETPIPPLDLGGQSTAKASNYSDVVSDGGLDPRNRTP